MKTKIRRSVKKSRKLAPVGPPRFNATRDEEQLIMNIVNRAYTLARDQLSPDDRLGLAMDLEAVHSSGHPLKLQDLLKAPDIDFVHDVFGIANNIDRRHGGLSDQFVPRYAVKQ